MRRKLGVCIAICTLITESMFVYVANADEKVNFFNDSVCHSEDIIENVESNTGIKCENEYILSDKENRIVDEAKKSQSGRDAAEKVNSLNGRAFENAVDEILNEYYNEDGTKDSKLNDFVKNIDSEAIEQINNYNEAFKERENEERLDYVTNNILVEFDGALSDENIENIIDIYAAGGDIITGKYDIDDNLPEEKKEKLKQFYEKLDTKIVSVNMKKNQTTDEAIELFKSMKCVKSTEKNNKQESCGDSITNDTDVDKQWYLRRICAPKAWDTLKKAKKCQKVKIAVIDTGADINHNDLKGRFDTKSSIEILNGKKTLFSNLEKTYSGNHGTRVTSIIGAKTNNNIGIAGVCGQNYSNGYLVELLEIKAGETDSWKPESGRFNIQDEIDSLEYAMSKGVDVVNISISGTVYSSSYQRQINNCRNSGIMVVAAAGNKGVSTATYPSDYEHVTSVIALNKSNDRWTSEKNGSSNYGSTKDISAPGTDIYACVPGNGYNATKEYASGTSFAAPMVSATAAMIKSVAPNLTPSDIETIIKSTAKDVGAEGKDDYTSYGLLDSGLALQRAIYRSYYDKKPTIESINSTEKTKVNITWNSVANEEDMLIYRASEKDGTYKRIGVVGEDKSGKYTFTDTGLISGKLYYYKIRCRSTYGDTYKYGVYSNIISAKAS